MSMEANQKWPRDGYRNEWLDVRIMAVPEGLSHILMIYKLEDAAGGRYIMTGNFDVDVPTYDAVFAGLAKQWPPITEELKVCA